MIKGTLLLGTGFVIGYSVAVANQERNEDVKEATAEFVRSMKAILNDAYLDAKNEKKAEGETTGEPEVVEPDAVEHPDEPSEGDKNA